MATFRFNKTKTLLIQLNITDAPNGYQIWWQPTHHGGCLQIIRFTDEENYKHDYLKNVFCTKRTGYSQLQKQLGISSSALRLGDKWEAQIMKAKSIKMNVRIKNKQVNYGMTTN